MEGKAFIKKLSEYRLKMSTCFEVVRKRGKLLKKN